MNFLLYSRVTRATGEQLAQALGIRSGATIPADVTEIHTLIRWGNSAEIHLTPRRELNSAQAIRLTTNKLEASRKLTADGVLTPQVIAAQELAGAENPLQILHERNFTLPILARDLTHTRGRDILLCLQARDIKRALRWGKEYFSQYIPTSREFRFHVVSDRVIRTSEKILKTREGYVPWLRNDDHNHIFSTAKTRTEYRDTAKAAVRSLGLDFAAIDLVVGDDGRPYVLEANTGPSLIEAGIDIYTEKFSGLLERE